MGIDLLDISFRLEKQFGVSMAKGENLALALFDTEPSGEYDATAGALHDLVCEQCRLAGRPVPPSSWTRVKLVLAEVLGVSPHEIRRDSMLVRDLGMS